MTDRLLASFAFAVFLGFLGILFWFVPQWDLGIVLALTLALAFWDLFFHDRGKG
ncbi:hypothetical protein [Oceanicella sp. SM1341]|uniref:hypothetical protein n=1 Tax=Oceanicella sp. SM1341 TaxID=1548889 RepID=UPI0018E59FAD|nr:hypothetical protein [Oceanicella sp. SM1341]